MNIIKNIRSKFSEVYRIRNGYGISVLRTERASKALYEFCKEELKNSYCEKYNKKRAMIYKKTIYLYENENESDKNRFFIDYVTEHLNWYWN